MFSNIYNNMTRHILIPALKTHPTLDDPRKPIKTASYTGLPSIKFGRSARVHPSFMQGRYTDTFILNPSHASIRASKQFNFGVNGDGVAMGF